MLQPRLSCDSVFDQTFSPSVCAQWNLYRNKVFDVKRHKHKNIFRNTKYLRHAVWVLKTPRQFWALLRKFPLHTLFYLSCKTKLKKVPGFFSSWRLWAWKLQHGKTKHNKYHHKSNLSKFLSSCHSYIMWFHGQTKLDDRPFPALPKEFLGIFGVYQSVLWRLPLIFSGKVSSEVRPPLRPIPLCSSPS